MHHAPIWTGNIDPVAQARDLARDDPVRDDFPRAYHGTIDRRRQIRQVVTFVVAHDVVTDQVQVKTGQYQTFTWSMWTSVAREWWPLGGTIGAIGDLPRPVGFGTAQGVTPGPDHEDEQRRISELAT